MKYLTYPGLEVHDRLYAPPKDCYSTQDLRSLMTLRARLAVLFNNRHKVLEYQLASKALGIVYREGCTILEHPSYPGAKVQLYSGYGICATVGISSFINHRQLDDLFKNWPLYSGPTDNTRFPIEGNRYGYEAARDKFALWDDERRWSLVSWLHVELGRIIEALQKM